MAQPKAADPMIAPDGLLPAKVPKNNAQDTSSRMAADALVRTQRAEADGAPGSNFGRLSSFLGLCRRYPKPVSGRARRSLLGHRSVHGYPTTRAAPCSERARCKGRAGLRWPAKYRGSSTTCLVVATRSISEKRLDALEPWDLESLCAYEPAYLSGFKAQRYQVELPAGFDRAKSVMQNAIEQDAARDIGGDEQRVENIDTAYSDTTFRHLLLPVWIGAYNFRPKFTRWWSMPGRAKCKASGRTAPGKSRHWWERYYSCSRSCCCCARRIEVSIVIRAAHVVAALVADQLAFQLGKPCAANRAIEHRLILTRRLHAAACRPRSCLAAPIAATIMAASIIGQPARLLSGYNEPSL